MSTPLILLRRACGAEEIDGERIRSLLREAQASNANIDKTTIEFLLRRKIEALALRFAAEPSKIERISDLQHTLKIIKQMPFPVNLWSAQNHVYSVQPGLYVRTKRRANRGDQKAQEWVEAYLNLSELLAIRVP